MIKPVYFPFTYISEGVASNLSAFFQKTDVYLPSSLNIPEKMEQYSSKRIIDIQIPSTNDEDKLFEFSNNFKNWINTHDGAEISFLNTQADTIPCFDESSPLKIKTDIKEQLLESSEQVSDPLFYARLFLNTAQEFDMQQEEINLKLKSCDNISRNLFDELKGENEDLFQPDIAEKNSDPGHYKTENRIKAWVKLFLAGQRKNNAENKNIFITTSQSVLDYVIDKIPDTKKMSEIQSLPLDDPGHKEWSASLMKYLETLMENKWDGSASVPDFTKSGANAQKNSLLIYIIPEKTPDQFTSSLIKNNPTENKKQNPDIKIKNTLIGLLI